MITDSMKLTVGPRVYRVRAGRNKEEWEEIARSMHHDPNAGICVTVYYVERHGVRRDFLNYAVRNEFLRVVE